MQGQSPYVINLSLSYQNEPLGTGISILYYKFGPRIVEVASIFNADWIETPKDLIDIVVNKEIGKHFEVKLGVKDLLAKDYEVKEKETVVRKISANTKLSLGVSYKL